MGIMNSIRRMNSASLLTESDTLLTVSIFSLHSHSSLIYDKGKIFYLQESYYIKIHTDNSRVFPFIWVNLERKRVNKISLIVHNSNILQVFLQVLQSSFLQTRTIIYCFHWCDNSYFMQKKTNLLILENNDFTTTWSKCVGILSVLSHTCLQLIYSRLNLKYIKAQAQVAQL